MTNLLRRLHYLATRALAAAVIFSIMALISMCSQGLYR